MGNQAFASQGGFCDVCVNTPPCGECNFKDRQVRRTVVRTIRFTKKEIAWIEKALISQIVKDGAIISFSHLIRTAVLKEVFNILKEE